MKPFETKGYSQYGASMGRRSVALTGPVDLYLVPLDSGGYDPGGAYWGAGDGIDPLYCATNETGEKYLRAKSREAAIDALEPECIIEPEDPTTMDDFTCAYITCMLWSSSDDGEEHLDEHHDYTDIDPATLAAIIADCKRFQAENSHLYNRGQDANAGHDFWLTRCGHGCGFWDGDWPEPQATALTDASRQAGNLDPYVGDDGRIYVFGMKM